MGYPVDVTGVHGNVKITDVTVTKSIEKVNSWGYTMCRINKRD